MHAHGPRQFLRTQLGGEWHQDRVEGSMVYYASFTTPYVQAMMQFLSAHGVDNYTVGNFTDGRATIRLTQANYDAIRADATGWRSQYARDHAPAAETVHAKRQRLGEITLQTMIYEQAGLTGQAIT